MPIPPFSSVGPKGNTGSAGSGSTLNFTSSSVTASVGSRYLTTGTISISDPTSPSPTAGQAYEVIIGSGTVSLGSVVYSKTGIELLRYYNGTSWSTIQPILQGVDAPSSSTDYSSLPNNTTPSGSQIYMANRNANTMWIISSSDANWKIVDKYSLS